MEKIIEFDNEQSCWIKVTEEKNVIITCSVDDKGEEVVEIKKGKIFINVKDMNDHSCYFIKGKGEEGHSSIELEILDDASGDIKKKRPIASNENKFLVVKEGEGFKIFFKEIDNAERRKVGLPEWNFWQNIIKESTINIKEILSSYLEKDKELAGIYSVLDIKDRIEELLDELSRVEEVDEDFYGKVVSKIAEIEEKIQDLIVTKQTTIKKYREDKNGKD